MTALVRLTEHFLRFLRRYPWLVALVGFFSGVASFLLVERKESLAQLIAVLMLVSWLGLVLENSLRRRLARWLGIEIPAEALRFATQIVHQESLFFVLPFFLITTTWASTQTVFTLMLGSAALVSLIDPLYYRMAKRRWLYLSFHSFTLFAALLATLPLMLHLTTGQSYQLALLIAVLLAFPSLSALLPNGRWWRTPMLLALLGALGVGGWMARHQVPPATLWLTRVAVTEQIDSEARAPGTSYRQIAERRLHTDGLYAYTAIRAPRGLKERIYHVWLLDGVEVDRIALDISGGRKEGYRAWTHKRHFPAQSAGEWQVLVLTETGQMIGRLDFSVVAVNAPASGEYPARPGQTSAVLPAG